MTDTITAISTPPGIGGIAVIRISGPEAIAACSHIFRPKNEQHTLPERKSHTLTFGQIISPETSETIDEVVVSLYRTPHSFTGEDVIEITCHGSLYIQQHILQLLSQLPSVRLAEPGEFTRRAFRNGRMDLAQAEAVADLISAQNASMLRMAMSQMKGTISRKLDHLRDQMLELTSLLELELDFSEEDVEFADRTKLKSLTAEILDEVTRLAETFQTGQAIKNGIPVAIIGETNAGKSTLLNQLLGDERAIVSDVHGTTRDVIEDTALIEGQLIRFIDTAGIRETTDKIEGIGIERTYQRISQARIVLWMIDASRLAEATGTEALISDSIQMYDRICPHLRPDQHLLILLNKTDLVQESALNLHLPSFKEAVSRHILTATKGDTTIFNAATNPKGVVTAPPSDAATSKDIGVSSDDVATLKCDATSTDGTATPFSFHQESNQEFLSPSYLPMAAGQNQGIDALRHLLSTAMRIPQISSSDVVISNIRHYHKLLEAAESLRRVQNGFDLFLSGDLLAEDLRMANQSLGDIHQSGTIGSQEVLNSIFSRFCIGK